MPRVRINRAGEGEGEGVGEVPGQVGGLQYGAVSPEVARITNNLTLADHIGRFIAGEVATQFQEENLADLLKGKNQIMISGSWG